MAVSAERNLKLRDLNAYLTCGLCQGYLVNAATVMECLHSFCKSCIVKHFEFKNNCPTCDSLVHETYPLNFVRLDPTMTDIVNKLVPDLLQSELKREAEFNTAHGIVPENNGGVDEGRAVCSLKVASSLSTNGAAYPVEGSDAEAAQSPCTSGMNSGAQPLVSNHRRAESPLPGPPKRKGEPKVFANQLSQNKAGVGDLIAISLEYDSKKSSKQKASKLRPLPRKFICVSSKAPVKVLSKFIRRKLLLMESTPVNIYFNNHLLGKEHTLEFLSRTLWNLSKMKMVSLTYTHGQMPH